MSCNLSLYRSEPCKDSVGGLDKVYFVNYGTLGAVSYDDPNDEMIETVAGIGGVDPNAYEYDIKGTSSFTQNIQSSRENGTTAFEQVLELTLHKLTVADHKELKLLSWGRPHVIIKDNNGNLSIQLYVKAESTDSAHSVQDLLTTIHKNRNSLEDGYNKLNSKLKELGIEMS